MCVTRRVSTPAERPVEGDEGWWAGRDNAALPEPTSSHANCLKTRRLPPRQPRRSPGDRVHAVLGEFPLCEAHYTNKALLPSRQNSYTQLNLSFHADSSSHLNLLLCRLSNQLYHLHDGRDRSLRLFNHDAVTAFFGKELLAVRR